MVEEIGGEVIVDANIVDDKLTTYLSKTCGDPN